MQLVIEISDGLYNNLGTIKNGSIASKIILDCVRKGQVLPKGHGALKDTDELRQNIVSHRYSDTFCEEHNIDWSINLGMVGILIGDTPTIIEADEGGN